MISGWTRKTPTPIPVISPATAAAINAMAIAGGAPIVMATDDVRNPASDATAPTDRSMPPVSIASVWQPARIASGIAARSVTPTWFALMLRGLTIPNATMSSQAGRRAG